MVTHTHPSTNRAHHMASTLIKTNALPLRQTTIIIIIKCIYVAQNRVMQLMRWPWPWPCAHHAACIVSVNYKVKCLSCVCSETSPYGSGLYARNGIVEIVAVSLFLPLTLMLDCVSCEGWVQSPRAKLCSPMMPKWENSFTQTCCLTSSRSNITVFCSTFVYLCVAAATVKSMSVCSLARM